MIVRQARRGRTTAPSSIQVLKGLEAVRKRPGHVHRVHRRERPAPPRLRGGGQLDRRGAGGVLRHDHGHDPPGQLDHRRRQRPRHPGGHPPDREDAGRRGGADRAARRRQVRQVRATRSRAASTASASRWSTRSPRSSRSGWTATASATTWRSCAARPRRSSSVIGKAKGTGTTVRFKPDHRDLQRSSSSATRTLADRLRQLAFLNKGVKITLKDERERPAKEETFHAKGGLVEFVQWLNRNKKALHPKPVHFSAIEGRRRGGPRPPVRGRLQREHLHLRQQHQHPRGRHPPDRVPVGADPDHQRLRQASGRPQEGRLHALAATTSARG